MRFEALGPLSVVGDEGVVRLRPAQRRLLAALLLDTDIELSTDKLLERMWPVEPPAKARNTLHAHMSALRRRVPGIIRSGPDWYHLALDGHDFDVDVFAQHVTEAMTWLDRDRAEEAKPRAEAAVAMWRGDPYPELLDVDAARAERARLTELYLSANTILATTLTRQGRLGESIALLQRLVVAHPLDEGFREQLVYSLYRAGRQADALRALTDARRVLREELGVDPGRALRELEDNILVHHPDLTPGNPPRAMLPDYRTSFVGRDADFSAVLDLVEHHRLVSITGEPGIGKTRLAVEVAERVQGRFPDGVVLIRLVGAVSESDVVATLVSAVGMSDTVGDISVLRHHLSGRRSLLILDNCEHVVDAVRKFVGQEGSAGTLHMLATSRTSLGVSGEQVWRLQPLEVPVADQNPLQSASVRLLADRASANGGAFSVESADIDHLIRLCRRTAGIPLALELAARWIPLLGVHETTDLMLEPAPNQATPTNPHHISLTHAIAWSLQTLQPEARLAFQAASVFKGRFTLDGLWRVGAPDRSRREAARIAAGLVDASVLSLERPEAGPVRYRMLEPLREYALTTLSPKSRRTLEDRHAQWFLEKSSMVASVAKGPDEAASLKETDEDVADFRAAMRYLLDKGRTAEAATIATALDRYWTARYLGTEAQRWLGEALKGEMGPGVRLRTLSVAGWTAYGIADYARSEYYYEECLGLARSIGDREREGEALYGLARIHLPRKERDGTNLLRQALTIFDDIGAELPAAECRLWLGIRAANAGRVEEANRWLHQSIGVLDRLGHMELVSVGRRYLSLAAWYARDEATSRHNLDLAESVARSANDHRIMSGALIQRGLVEGRWGDPGVAARAIIDAMAPIPENNDIDYCLIAFGAFPALIRTSRWVFAARLLAHLDRIYEEYGWTPLEERLPMTAEFRLTISDALADSSTDYMPVSSAAMAMELVEELNAISAR